MPARAALAVLLLAPLAACGGDTGGGDTGGASGGETVTAGNPEDPCSLLAPADFEEVLGASSVSDPEDVSGSFELSGEDELGVESSTCQWQVQRPGEEVAVESFSVQLRAVAGPEAEAVHDAEAEFAERFEPPPEPIDGVGLEAVAYRDFGDPAVLARASELVILLDASSDELGVDPVAELARRALAAAGA